MRYFLVFAISHGAQLRTINTGFGAVKFPTHGEVVDYIKKNDSNAEQVSVTGISEVTKEDFERFQSDI